MTRYVLQSLSEFLERGGHDCRTICEVSPPDVRGISHVRHQSIRMSLQIARVAVCQRGERLRGPRRDRQHVARPLHDLSPLAFGGRFLEDHMRVGAPEPEGAHCASPQLRAFRPCAECGGDYHRRLIQPEQRIGSSEVQVRWDLTMTEHEHDLDQSRDARRTFQVADVRLYRADHQGFIVPPALAEHRA